MTAAQDVHQITSQERQHFRTQGYLGPFELCSPEEMAQIRPDIEQVLNSDPPGHKTRIHNRHLDCPLIHELATHPAIVERMACLYGRDLLLWRTNFFVKYPGDKEIPWHQDFNYWPLEPPVIASAWIAVDPATRANSCLQIIPGSHRKIVPHVEATPDMVFNQMGDADYIDTSQAIDLEMQPGQFILFNERTVHHSEPNRSDQRRIGLAVRVIVPMVEVLSWDAPDHALVVISGRDRLGFNRVAGAPA